MKEKIEPLAGFRDTNPELAIARQQVFATIRGVYEKYGFVPLETPALERMSTLQGKYGEESEKLIYQLDDQGGRRLGMRYDLTVPLCRYVAQHEQELNMPFKRYQAAPVWRGESPQAGRYREFYQFDADAVGAKGPLADAEIVAMMADTMKALGVPAVVRVNNRLILDALVQKAGVEDKEKMRLIGWIDKLEKIGEEAVVSSVNMEFGNTAGEVITNYLEASRLSDTTEKINKLKEVLGDSEQANTGLNNINEVFTILTAGNYKPEQIVFDPTIARGLDYYTGIIFETTVKGAEKLGSVCSGGRYDNLISAMGGPDLPAVGTSVGVDRLMAVMEKLGKVKLQPTTAEVVVTNFAAELAPAYLGIATTLRDAGIPTEVNPEPDKLGRQLKKAGEKGIRYAIIAGPDELGEGKVKIKDLVTREEKVVPLADVADEIRK